MTQYTYALVDGVMQQTAIKDLYKTKEPIQVMPLYIGTRFQDNYDLGPILVASLENNSQLINRLQQTCSNSTSFITTEQPLSTVASHLKQFITVTDESGSYSLFRFADPLTTWYWLDSYQNDIPSDIFGPINIWQVINPVADWYTPTSQWQAFTSRKEASLNGVRLDYLNEPQVKALDNAANFRFKNKLYQWVHDVRPKVLHNKAPEQITQWLDQILRGAQEYNLTNQRSIAQWLDLSIDYGIDFAVQPTSEYQQWLQQNNQYKALPNDLKIQNFYQYIVQQG